MVFGEFCGKRRPHIAGFAIALQQHYGGADAADPDIKRHAVGRNFSGAKIRRIRLCALRRFERRRFGACHIWQSPLPNAGTDRSPYGSASTVSFVVRRLHIPSHYSRFQGTGWFHRVPRVQPCKRPYAPPDLLIDFTPLHVKAVAEGL